MSALGDVLRNQVGESCASDAQDPRTVAAEGNSPWCIASPPDEAVLIEGPVEVGKERCDKCEANEEGGVEHDESDWALPELM